MINDLIRDHFDRISVVVVDLDRSHHLARDNVDGVPVGTQTSTIHFQFIPDPFIIIGILKD